MWYQHLGGKRHLSTKATPMPLFSFSQPSLKRTLPQHVLVAAKIALGAAALICSLRSYLYANTLELQAQLWCSFGQKVFSRNALQKNRGSASSAHREEGKGVQPPGARDK